MIQPYIYSSFCCEFVIIDTVYQLIGLAAVILSLIAKFTACNSQFYNSSFAYMFFLNIQEDVGILLLHLKTQSIEVVIE